jgi:hypothetical protein
MTTERKPFDAVAAMRKTRDKLSRRFKKMTFAEQKREMEKLAKRRAEAESRPNRLSVAKNPYVWN